MGSYARDNLWLVPFSALFLIRYRTNIDFCEPLFDTSLIISHTQAKRPSYPYEVNHRYESLKDKAWLDFPCKKPNC